MSKGRWMFVSLAAVIGGLWLAYHVSYYRLTGQFFATNIYERLEGPVAVESWSPDGLQLADGRTVQLPGFSALPEESQALDEATRRGVEIGADGHVTGLVKLWHCCGNDPVRNHVVRVDLAYLLMFTHEGQYVEAPPELKEWPPDTMAEIIEGRREFSEYGWGLIDYHFLQEYVEQAG